MNSGGTSSPETRQPILSVRDLSIEIETRSGRLPIVDSLSFDLYRGETLALVGESGAGKSVTVLAMLGLLPQPPMRVASGEVIFEGKTDLLKLSPRALRRIRGKDIAMVFQDPMTSLNPIFKTGWQIQEAIRVHDRRASRRAAHERSVGLLRDVEVPDAERRVNEYPHEFSGGMRQRAVIAMAMANTPTVLIADEPTTALDVTVQAQVLEVLQKVQRETDAAAILITHDLGLVAEMADRVVTMYAGRAVETGDVMSVFQQPLHPYTLGLMRSLPRLDGDQDRLDPIPGQPPNLSHLPTGCAFHPRCELSGGRAVCRDQTPALLEVEPAHRSACHFAREVPKPAGQVVKGGV